MSLLPNIFQDPALAARQQQLNAQWIALNNLNPCDGVPDSAWLEFINDYKAWQDFYDSGSDWSDDSLKATDFWQLKAQEWAKRYKDYGCAGSLGVVTTTDSFGNPTGRTEIYAGGDQGIPGVKDPPPPEKGITDKVEDAIATAGWVAAGLALLLILGVIYILSRPSLHAAAGSYGRKS